MDVCLQIYSLLLCMQSLLELLSKSNELFYQSIVTASPWVYTVAENSHNVGSLWHAYSTKKLLVGAELLRTSNMLWPRPLQDGSGVSQKVPCQESECWPFGTPIYKEMKVITLFFWLLKFAVLSFGEVPCIWQWMLFSLAKFNLKIVYPQIFTVCSINFLWHGDRHTGLNVFCNSKYSLKLFWKDYFSMF